MDTLGYESDTSIVTDTTRNSENLQSPVLFLGLNMLGQTFNTSKVDISTDSKEEDVNMSPIIPVLPSTEISQIYEGVDVEVTYSSELEIEDLTSVLPNILMFESIPLNTEGKTVNLTTEPNGMCANSDTESSHSVSLLSNIKFENQSFQLKQNDANFAELEHEPHLDKTESEIIITSDQQTNKTKPHVTPNIVNRNKVEHLTLTNNDQRNKSFYSSDHKPLVKDTSANAENKSASDKDVKGFEKLIIDRMVTRDAQNIGVTLMKQQSSSPSIFANDENCYRKHVNMTYLNGDEGYIDMTKDTNLDSSQNQETVHSQRLVTSSTVELSNDKTKTNLTKENIEFSQNLFDDTQNTESSQSDAPKTFVFPVKDKVHNANGLEFRNKDSETQFEQTDTFRMATQDSLMNCLSFSQVSGSLKDDQYNSNFTTTQTSSTSSLSSLENINPAEDWKYLTMQEQHIREKKVIERMGKIQENIKKRLMLTEEFEDLNDMEKMKRKFKIVQCILKQLSEYHKQERERLSGLIKKTNKSKAEKIHLRTRLHQLSDRQKAMFKVFQQHKELANSMKRRKLGNMSFPNVGQSNVPRIESQVGQFTHFCSRNDFENDISYGKKDFHLPNTFSVRKVIKETNQQKTSLKNPPKRTNYIKRTKEINKNNDVNKDNEVNRKRKMGSVKIQPSMNKMIIVRKQTTFQDKNKIFATDEVIMPSIISSPSLKKTGEKTILPRLQQKKVVSENTLLQGNDKEFICETSVEGKTSKFIDTASIKPNTVSESQVDANVFKSPQGTTKTGDNISPSTASCSDVFPVTSQEIHKRYLLKTCRAIINPTAGNVDHEDPLIFTKNSVYDKGDCRSEFTGKGHLSSNNVFKSPTNRRGQTNNENISPSTASCSDVFPVKSTEIHRRVQMRLSQSNMDTDVTNEPRVHNLTTTLSQPVVTGEQLSKEDAFDNESNIVKSNLTEREKFDGLKYPPLEHLINKGILRPGKNILSMKNKNKTYLGTLTENGQIESVGGEKFRSPVQWMTSVSEGRKIVKARAYREEIKLTQCNRKDIPEHSYNAYEEKNGNEQRQ